jgi:hypothetical protein
MLAPRRDLGARECLKLINEIRGQPGKFPKELFRGFVGAARKEPRLVCANINQEKHEHDDADGEDYSRECRVLK